MKKLAYFIAMTYPISDEEKSYAEQVVMKTDDVLHSIELASDYIDIIKTPFKNNPESSQDEILESRVALRRFRDTCIENFNKFKEKAARLIKSLEFFEKDPAMSKIISSLVSSIEILETNVNDFADYFDNLKDAEFQSNIVEQSEKIQKNCEDITDMIKSRVRTYLNDNIIAKNWMDGINLNEEGET